MMRSSLENLGSRISTLPFSSIPFRMGVFTAVTVSIIFITQKLVCASSDRIADFGRVWALYLILLTIRTFAMRFCGMGISELTLMTTGCVCERESTTGMTALI